MGFQSGHRARFLFGEAVRERLLEMLEPVVEALGYELVELECRLGGGSGLLRLYIDGPEGITLDDCERVSHQVSGVLDVEDPIPSAYNLEVSSPGLDRPLRKPAHFARFAGARARVELAAPQDGRRRFTGTLQGLRGDALVIAVDGEEFVLRLADIEKARLVPEH